MATETIRELTPIERQVLQTRRLRVEQAQAALGFAMQTYQETVDMLTNKEEGVLVDFQSGTLVRKEVSDGE